MKEGSARVKFAEDCHFAPEAAGVRQLVVERKLMCLLLMNLIPGKVHS